VVLNAVMQTAFGEQRSFLAYTHIWNLKQAIVGEQRLAGAIPDEREKNPRRTATVGCKGPS